MTDTPPGVPTTHLITAHECKVLLRRPISSNLGFVGVAFFCVGVSLLLQPDRWVRSTSYANLLGVAPTYVWGSIYLVVALPMTFAAWWPAPRMVAVVAHTAGITLSLSWTIGFAVRYLTNDSATPLAVLAWATFLAVLIRSAVVLDDGHEPAALIHRRKAP